MSIDQILVTSAGIFRISFYNGKRFYEFVDQVINRIFCHPNPKSLKIYKTLKLLPGSDLHERVRLPVPWLLE